MMMDKRRAQALQDRIATAELYRAGLSIAEIASRLGLNHSAVRQRLEKAGVTLPKRMPPSKPSASAPPKPRKAPETRQCNFGGLIEPCPRCGVRSNVGCKHTAKPVPPVLVIPQFGD
jgi:hypothetical protein